MLQEFVNYLNEQVINHSIYVWGAQGQTGNQITEAWIRSRETSVVNANRAIAYWKKQIKAGYTKLRAFDCSGLGMYFIQNLKKLSNDLNSRGMYAKCTKLSKSQLKKGDWVFRSGSNGIYHVGYVVDDDLNVIEARGRDHGVVKRPLNASGTSYWNRFGRPKWFADEIEGGDTVEVIAKAVNVRDADSKDGNIVGVSRKGDKFKYIKNAPSGWYQIEHDGKTAYISNRSDLTRRTAWTLGRLIKKTSPLMSGNDVANIQRALEAAGYSVGKHGADGKFGNNSESAVIAYQKANKLKADGIVGKDTVTALGGIWAK